jgi:hypothetical protein
MQLLSKELASIVETLKPYIFSVDFSGYPALARDDAFS